jgi:hypothetical protein
MTAPVLPPALPPASASSSAPVSGRKRGNPLGLASLIIGVVALICANVGLLTFVAWVPGFVAVALGISALVAKDRKRATGVLGFITGALAIIMGIIWSIGSVVLLVEWATGAPIGTDPDPDGPLRLRYSITGDGLTSDSVTHDALGGPDASVEQVSDTRVPWTENELVERGIPLNYSSVTLSAQASSDSTMITCRITLDGDVIAEDRATGPNAVVTCVGDVSGFVD